MKWFALCLFVTLIGMAIAVPKGQHVPPKIELLMFDGCPNSPKMKANLQVAMKSLHLTQKIKVVDILKLPAGDVRKGYGAPTVLLGGKDLFGRPTPNEASASCRLYPGGVPTPAEIKKRLEAALMGGVL